MKKITQQDIADSLSISRLTVSKALAGAVTVTDRTRRLVIEQAYRMGYRKLSQSHLDYLEEYNSRNTFLKKKVIGLVTYIYCTTDSYWSAVISGISQVLSSNSCEIKLIFVNKINDYEFEYPANHSSEDVEGLILVGAYSEHHLEKLREAGLPMVAVDRKEKGRLCCDVIMTENKQPVYEITNDLIGKGHINIGFVGQKEATLSFSERFEGFEAAMNEAGLEIKPEYCFFTTSDNPFDPNEIVQWASKRWEFPTAIICANDASAMALMMHLSTRGIKVPEQVAVTGFDNIGDSVIARLTTVNVPRVEIGMRIAEQILWRIDNPSRPFELIRMDAEPIFRHSTYKRPNSKRFS